MLPDDPRHGTHAGWQAHKKDGEPVCDACKLGAYRYHKRKRARLASGVKSRVTLGETAWRIIDENPRKALHLSTGIAVAKICEYHKGGPDTPVLQSTRDKIEAFTPHDVLTPIGIQRRIRALNRLGYSAAAIAETAGVNVESVKDARREGHIPSFVKQDFADRIAGAYDRLSMTLPAPSRSVSKARGTAQRKGWAPPLAYDNIDDPAAKPAGMGSDAHRALTRGDELLHLAHIGETLESACTQLGISRDSLWRWCRRNGHRDLYERLAQRPEARATAMAADDPRHGTVNGYLNQGCRCDDCRAAGTADRMARKRRAAEKAAA